mmetsp:Transcript_16233/g.32916  ORF Transcript_16233/g.32916 Transcript_16233/m.32916 type:complete len:252 (-) Transcript_16233:362-1117(-)
MSNVQARVAVPRCVSDKYLYQRYRLFERFDDGIVLDEESWFSVTPEKIARHIAERCLDGSVVLDPFVGAGGNAIQFAMQCSLVLAIDIDPLKIELTRNNAHVYGVADRIECLTGNALELLPLLHGALDHSRCGPLLWVPSFTSSPPCLGKVDVIFLSPPWGGPDYIQHQPFLLSEHLQPYRALDLLNLSFQVTPNVAFLVPRNIDLQDLSRLLAQCIPPQTHCEVEYNFLGQKCKTATLYFGALIGTQIQP